MNDKAKRALAATIRDLRLQLVGDEAGQQEGQLHGAMESRYRLSLAIERAGLTEEHRERRRRLEAWIEEQVRAASGEPGAAARFRRDLEKQAAYTLLNRLVFLRLLEAAGLRAPAVVTGGWESRAYKDFRQLAPALVRDDETEGYGYLLQLVFEDLATELPGLYGRRLSDLVPVPAATLRAVVAALDDPDLASCWTDDMTLGWVYQYWNDPEREAIDAKLHGGGKVEPHEIASKTQMFTERYMVEWLLHNSLGPMWLTMCRKHDWTPDVEAEGPDGRSLLKRLDERRADWRRRREERQAALDEARRRQAADPAYSFDEDALPGVALDALMPFESDAERRWAYYVPQPIPDDAVAKAPETVADLRVLDPACGSGHFLVVAFDLLFALFREEARHRGTSAAWPDARIAKHIVEHNLYGLELDPRAVQIAAAAVWLKAKRTARDADIGRMNLVASQLRLAALPHSDPARVELRDAIRAETGIPGELTERILAALAGADHLGTLLRVDRAVADAIDAWEASLPPRQMEMYRGAAPASGPAAFDREEARRSIEARLDAFLEHHTRWEDLGLRLRGEQLAAGVRFVRMLAEGQYDLVVANPPYQGTAKMRDAGYVQKHYPRGKADLFAAFLERGLQLARDGGTSAMLTMRNWMFIHQYASLRVWLLETYDLRALGDFDRGAFEDVPDEVVAVAASVFRRAVPSGVDAVALQPTPVDDRSRDSARTARKRSATLAHRSRYQFPVAELAAISEMPLVYWWHAEMRRRYVETPKVADAYAVRQGAATSNNTRFLRKHWECASVEARHATRGTPLAPWPAFIRGGAGRVWFEPLVDVIEWSSHGLAVKSLAEALYASHSRTIKNEQWYFHRGVSFAAIGSTFSASVHRYPGVFGHTGSSAFPDDPAELVCLFNSSTARDVLAALNPGVHFEVGDVNRLPLFPVANADDVFATLDDAFTEHESHREPSVEFRRPGPSPWRSAQDWAQLAVDRPEGAPLPPYEPQHDPEPPTDRVSYALGVALGRFGPNAEGILDPATANLEHALPAGLLFLDGTLEPTDTNDGLGHPAARPLHAAWEAYASEIAKSDLRPYLRASFFPEVHRKMYESRPIHWPLSSESKTFVAWVNIHRFDSTTLRVLLADHLHPTLARIEGELADLDAVRFGGDKKAARNAERRHGTLTKAREELRKFIRDVEQCGDKGPPPADPKCPAREADARYAPDLDDGVMVNSAALWPLFDPQWKDPKKWWKELATASGRKDYDWSHLAMRYWPTRVDEKCRRDPSLAVAHGRFWRYHPERAWSWELRLQDEIGPDFRLDEADAAEHRAAFLRDHPAAALTAIEKEALRRRRKRKAPQPSLTLLEPGLWTTVPDQVWALELRLIPRLGGDFRLLAPDEPAARAAYEAAHPKEVARRTDALNAAAGSWFEEADETPDDETPEDDGGDDN